MFCQKCGNQLNEGAAFCPKCGTAVETEQAAHVQSAAGDRAAKAEPKKRRIGLIVLAVIFVLLVVAGVSLIFIYRSADGGNSTPQPTAAASPTDSPKPSSTPNTIESTKTPEPSVKPEQPAYSVPALSDVVELFDDDATVLVGAVPRQSLIDAWGSPNVEHDSSDDIQDFDEWVYSANGYVTYVDVYYNLNDKTVSELCMFSNSGKVTGYIEEDRTEVIYWNDVASNDFYDWAAHEAVSGSSTDSIMNRFYDSGLTRNAVRELFGDPDGAFSDGHGAYLGDVFWLRDDTSDASLFLLVQYDETMNTVPVSVSTVSDKDSAGNMLDGPVLKNGWEYFPGIYNSVYNPAAIR